MKLVGIVVVACLLAQACFCSEIDVEALAASAKPVKEYEKTPDAREFLNVDTVELKQPRLFKEPSINALDAESEEALTKSILNLVIYGSMAELVRDSRNEKAKPGEILSRVNLRKFFKQLDEYALETTMQFPVPTHLRLSLDLPNQLNTGVLDDKFESLELQIHLNYENYSPATKSDFDQLLCSIKDQATIWLADTSKLKESYQAALKPGRCLFVPKNWTVAIKSSQVWLVSIKWTSLSEPVPKSETKEEPRKLIAVLVNQDQNMSFFPFVSHLISYFNKDTGLDETPYNKTSFLTQLKTDQVINTGIFNWDQKTIDLSDKLFRILDIDKDGSFGIEDLEHLDHTSSAQLNEKIQGVVDAFQKIQLEQVELLKKLIEDWKARTPELDMRKQLADMFRVKMNEWYDNLGEAEKEELKKKNVDMNLLIDQLLDVNLESQLNGESDQEARERLKKKIIEENILKQKQRGASDSDDSIFEDDKKAATIKSIDDDIDEILADDDDDDDDDDDEDEAPSTPKPPAKEASSKKSEL